MKRVVCAVLALVLCLPFTMPLAANPFVFLVSETDVLPFHDAYLPRYGSDGALMISGKALRTIFPALIAVWEPEARNYTLLYTTRILTFESGRGTAFSPNSTYEAEMLILDIDGETVYYMPLELLRDFFDWHYSLNETEWGTMLRLTAKSPPVITDKTFLSIYTSRINTAYQEYIASKNPTTVPAPTTLPPASVSPSPSPQHSSSPAPTPTPAPDPLPLYITFEGAMSAAAEEIDALLWDNGIPAVFFWDTQSLAERPDVLRRMSARYITGLLLQAGSTAYEHMLAEGNDRLAALIFRRCFLYRVPEDTADPQITDELERKGYQLWTHGLRLTADMSAEEMISEIDSLSARSTQILTLPVCEQSLTVLTQLIARRNSGQVQIYAFEAGARPA